MLATRYNVEKEEVPEDQLALPRLSPAELIAIVLGEIAMLSFAVAMGVLVEVKTRPGIRDGGRGQKEETKTNKSNLNALRRVRQLFRYTIFWIDLEMCNVISLWRSSFVTIFHFEMDLSHFFVHIPGRYITFSYMVLFWSLDHY
jgi:hypothetical protein